MEFKNLDFYSNVPQWPLFPCSHFSKKPLTEHGFKGATIDLKVLAAWHNQHPGCAWGLATTATVGVLDVDVKDGGPATLASLEAIHGPLPLTVQAKTGGGGSTFTSRSPAEQGHRRAGLASGLM